MALVMFDDAFEAFMKNAEAGAVQRSGVATSIADAKLAKLKAPDEDARRMVLSRAQATANRRMSAIRRFANWLEEEGRLTASVEGLAGYGRI